ncbi:MAG: hypothetical protein U0324_37885 [Polyangiales bacterium]
MWRPLLNVIERAPAGAQFALPDLLDAPDITEAQRAQWREELEFPRHRRLPQVADELTREPERIRVLYEDR